MTEEWQPVIGYDGFYEISSFGRVRSLVRETCRGRRGGQVMKPVRNKNGYLQVVLTASALDKREIKYIHQLVLEAFIGPRPDNADACHYPDPSRDNCRLDNLRWDSRASNHHDKKIHGTHRMGESHPMARLSEASVRQIRELGKSGMKRAEIADLHHVSRGTVSSILSRRRWAHITNEAQA